MNASDTSLIDGGQVMHDPRDDDECPICGGEGFTFDCFDGCCEDAEIGCDDCTRPCQCQKRQASPELQEVVREALAHTSTVSNTPEGK